MIRRTGTRPSDRTLALGGVLLIALVAGIVIAVTNPFAGGARASGVIDNQSPTSLTRVKRGPLSSQVTGVGTLGYIAQADGSPYSVVNQATGTFTSLPTTGQVIRQGQVIWRVTNNPVVLLNGGTPAYRSLSEGAVGPDVKEFNADLVAMGYASSSSLDPTSDHFSSATASALQKLQGRLGVSETGSLDLGQAVFLPGPVRITKINATLGTGARPGAPAAQATSTRRQVQVNIDATQQATLRAGQSVVITLPNYRDTPGVVTGVGTVATGSGSSTPTIPVHITLKHPRTAGTLDQAPVRVQITTAGVPDALIVPINALLAQNGGGYALETVDARRVHHLLPVTLGLFDDADGLVQVNGPGLAAGQQIVVPGT